MATKTQIINLAKRIEALADASASQGASISIINIPDGMDRERVLGGHRRRWPVNCHGRGPILVVWVSTSAAAVHDARGEPAGSEPHCDDVSWREVAREQNDGR
jgi:hypothetical protein